MSNSNELLGTQIAKYRKAAGITQEELGKAVGVSTQAVSRWECGGAPDVSLLPALADRLGVTIDALYGRGEGKTQDIYETFINWLTAIPVSQRMDRVFRLVAGTQDLLIYKHPAFDVRDYKQLADISSYNESHDLMRAAYSLREGITLATLGEDCPFYLLMPEPAGGYEANLLSTEEYRELFELLGRPGTVEILVYLHRRFHRYFTVYALAQHAGLDPREAEPLLKGLAKLGLLETQTIESEHGTEPIYAYRDGHGFIPFLFMARWITDPSESWRGVWTNRDKPLLPPEETPEEGKQ